MQRVVAAARHGRWRLRLPERRTVVKRLYKEKRLERQYKLALPKIADDTQSVTQAIPGSPSARPAM